MATVNTADNRWATSNFIVAPTIAEGASYTTIAAALTAASSGNTIFIKPGTYTENLTLKAGVNLTAFGCDSSFDGTGHVIISGTCTLTTAGSVTISGIQLQTNSANLLAVTGSAASIVNLQNCYLNCTNNTGISFTSSSASSQINLMSCIGNLGTTGIAIFAHSGAGSLTIVNNYITNTGASSTASTLSGSGNIFMIGTRIFNPITTSSTSSFSCNACTINAGTNTAFTCNGTGNNNVQGTAFVSSTSSAISIGASVTLKIYSCQVNSSNTDAIAGTGTINYSCLSFGDTSANIAVGLTQDGGTIQGSRNTVPEAGFLGEQIRSFVNSASPVSISNNTAIDITSINLTAGIWDVSGIITFAGATTGTTLALSISTTSATQAANGDARVIFPFLSQASSNLSLTLPSLRFTFSTTTTVYLVAFSVYSAGTQTGWGRISATRVG